MDCKIESGKGAEVFICELEKCTEWRKKWERYLNT